jgi:hypothetical protein
MVELVSAAWSLAGQVEATAPGSVCSWRGWKESAGALPRAAVANEQATGGSIQKPFSILTAQGVAVRATSRFGQVRALAEGR